MSDDGLLNEDVEDFAMVLGFYVMLTSATEAHFLDILQLILADDTGAHRAIWLQFHSTRARVDMVRHAFRNRFGTDSPPTKELAILATRSKNLTAQRNYFCHSIYSLDGRGGLKITGMKVIENDEGIKLVRSAADAAAINQIKDLCSRMELLVDDLREFVWRLQEALFAQGDIKERLVDIDKPPGNWRIDDL